MEDSEINQRSERESVSMKTREMIEEGEERGEGGGEQCKDREKRTFMKGTNGLK